MSRVKIDYGIDLGTTNSAIARMENGNPKIIKSEGYSKDTTPSCVGFTINGRILFGDLAYTSLNKQRKKAAVANDKSLVNTYEEFKRTMGTDKRYKSLNMQQDFASKELSSEVLKALKNYVRDDEVNAIVITVPAKFQGFQKDATIEAAKSAGFQHCILLQEPIAASMAFGIDSDNVNGSWLIFDFGGGTFDVALMSVSEGIMRVVDTGGDNYLGGKNIDLTIVNEILISHIEKKYSIHDILQNKEKKTQLVNALKREAEMMKIAFSSKVKTDYDLLTDDPIGKDGDGNEIDINLTVTINEYEKVVKPIFQRAIDITLELLKENNVNKNVLETILMVGGPTLSETFREMVRAQITDNINISIDPMTVVARGAALFASTKDIPEDIRVIDKSKVQLKLMYPSDTVEMEEKIGIKILREKNETELPEKFYLEIESEDKSWVSGKTEVTDAEIIDIPLNPGKSNSFNIVLLDESGEKYEVEPNKFSIIQGFKTAGATLPFDLCLDVYDLSKRKAQVVRIDGLNKNKLLPAKGKGTYQTAKDIRPGNISDIIRIPLFYAEDQTKSIYNLYRGEVIIDGNKLGGFLPKGSDVELSIEIDESEQIKVSATFPYIDDFILDEVIHKDEQKTESKDQLNNILVSEEEELMSNFEEDNSPQVYTIKNKLNDIGNELERDGDDVDKRQELRGRMQEALKELDEVVEQSQWPKVEKELLETLESMKSLQEEHGDHETQIVVNDLLEKAKAVQASKEVYTAENLIEQIRAINYYIVEKDVGQLPILISFIKGYDDDFDLHEWRDVRRAKSLLSQAKELIYSEHVTESKLKPIVNQLFELLPRADQPMSQTNDDLLTR